jgi:hypothetical protein
VTPLAVLAAVAATIGGGTYQGKVDTPCDSTCIARLVVVDDGHSLTTRSFVGAPCDFAETTDGHSRPAPRGTPVRAGGSFRWRTRFQAVEGRFAADGRSVSGTARFLGRARDDCSAATFTFTAPLKRHVKPSGRCESVDTHGLEIEVFARGCTKATRVVDAWSAKHACRALRTCRAGGRSCTPLLGGRLSGLASVGCPRGRLELVITKSCGGAGPTTSVDAINVGCGVARGVAQAWERTSGCARHSCGVAGWRCRPRGPGSTRCRQPHAAIEVSRLVPVPGTGPD